MIWVTEVLLFHLPYKSRFVERPWYSARQYSFTWGITPCFTYWSLRKERIFWKTNSHCLWYCRSWNKQFALQMLKASSLKSKIIFSPSQPRPSLNHNASVAVFKIPLIKKVVWDSCTIHQHKNNIFSESVMQYLGRGGGVVVCVNINVN